MKTEDTTETGSLRELYHHLGLTLEADSTEGFTIHNLKETGFDLPYQSPSFRPNYFSFLFVKDGRGEYSIDNLHFEVKAHSIYFTNPSNYRTFSWEIIEDIYLITFDEFFLTKYLGHQVFEEFPFLLTETISPKVITTEFFTIADRLYQDIYTEYITHNNDKYRIIAHLLAVLLYRIKDYFWKDYDPIYEGNRSSQIVKEFKKLLDKHYRDIHAGKTEDIFRVQDYADAQHLNPNYLSNVIKSKTGKPITAWITEKNITEAKLLLKKTKLSVKEISYRLGFAETAHFSNYFKKNTSLSPVEFRQQD